MQLGCGQGLPSLVAAALYPSCSVTLTDCSCKGLRILRTRCAQILSEKRCLSSWSSWGTDDATIRIRRHIWESDMKSEHDSLQGDVHAVRHWSNAEEDDDPVPMLEPHGKFDVILASDVAYFR